MFSLHLIIFLESSLKKNQGWFLEAGYKIMKKESSLHSSLMKRIRKENEFHQAQGSLLLEIKIEGMEESRNHPTLNATIVIRKATMLETALRRTMVLATTLEATIIGLIIK